MSELHLKHAQSSIIIYLLIKITEVLDEMLSMF